MREANLNDTQKLCVYCLDLRDTTDVSEILDINNVDWSAFVNYGISHKVAGFIKYKYDKCGAFSIADSDAIEVLGSHLNKRHHRVDNESKSELINLLNKNQINYAVLKGPALQKTIYSGFDDVRYSVDIDLLVEQGQAKHAFDLLINNGYINLDIHSEYSSEWEILFCNLSHHYPPIHKDNLYVEIHHRLNQGFLSEALDCNILLGNVLSIDSEFGRINIFDEYDTLLSLCYHLTYHHCYCFNHTLKENVDIINFIRYYTVYNWTEFISRVKRHKVQFLATYALYFTNELYNNVFKKPLITDDIIKQIAPPNFMEEKDAVKSRYFLSEDSYGMWDVPYSERILEQDVDGSAKMKAIYKYLLQKEMGKYVRALGLRNIKPSASTGKYY